MSDLAAAGYDVLGVDPDAPDGPAFRRARFQEVDEAYDAVERFIKQHKRTPARAAATA